MKIKTSKLVLTPLFTALTAAGAFISIPIGPVPITLQNLPVALAGLFLGPVYGFVSQLLYLLLGLFGVPIFASGTSGFPTVMTPAFGFILGFLLAPVVTGNLLRLRRKRSFLWILLSAAAGFLSVYLLGIPYMYIIVHTVLHTGMTIQNVLTAGFLIFLPGDAAKCALAALLGYKLLPVFERMNRA